jgi:hypothetical protein
MSGVNIQPHERGVRLSIDDGKKEMYLDEGDCVKCTIARFNHNGIKIKEIIGRVSFFTRGSNKNGNNLHSIFINYNDENGIKQVVTIDKNTYIETIDSIEKVDCNGKMNYNLRNSIFTPAKVIENKLLEQEFLHNFTLKQADFIGSKPPGLTRNKLINMRKGRKLHPGDPDWSTGGRRKTMRRKKSHNK